MRYRVILEFDHPGDGVKVDEHSTTNAPNRWNWKEILADDVSNIKAQAFVKDEWKELPVSRNYAWRDDD